jgi:hypothetical protein
MKYVIKSKGFLSKEDLHLLLTKYSFVLNLHPVQKDDVYLCKNTNVLRKTCKGGSYVYAHIIDDSELSNSEVYKSFQPMRLSSYTARFSQAPYRGLNLAERDIKAVFFNIHKDNLVCPQRYVQRYFKYGNNLSLDQVREDVEPMRNYLKRQFHA